MGVTMNASTICHQTRVVALGALIASALANASFAQGAGAPVVPAAAAAPAAPARVDVPDGAPQLAAEKVVSNHSQGPSDKATGNVVIEEERIQGRLANASVSVGGAKGYSVVDPAVGRVDRQADNGGKRVSPSLWQLFKF
jgi:hypothetical protein